MLCVKMFEYIEHVSKARVSLNVNILTVESKVDIFRFYWFGTFLRLSPLRSMGVNQKRVDSLGP